MRKRICCLFVFCCFLPSLSPAFAQGENKLATLSKKIIETQTNSGLYAAFQELKDLYLQENKFNEFVDFLRSLTLQKKALEPFADYYIAFTRYQQLKYLEEKLLWDEYFAQGNTYRDEITTDAGNAISLTKPDDPLGVYARLILWQFHKGQQDAFAESSLTDLVNSALAYSQVSSDISPIKEAADKLSAYAEKAGAKKLYRVYADKLIASSIKEETLLKTALGFYNDGNLELAESLYDAYIARITKAGSPSEKSIPVLIDIAKLFAYKDKGLNDMPYAEKIFQKIEESGGPGALDQELNYMRAFNLEKAKEFSKAKDIYLQLLKRFPSNPYNDEAYFKIAIIYTYILRDIKSSRSYLEELAKKETLSPQVISSLYQLGLLSQWEGDAVKAKGYYSQLLELAKNDFGDSVTLAKERLKEIEGALPIEYNLKLFMDVSLKDEYSALDMAKLDLRSNPYKANKGQGINIDSTAYAGASGCMQVELQYLWSGTLGKTKPTLEQSSFDTSYALSGTKEINLVVVSPSGIIDRNLDLLDVD